MKLAPKITLFLVLGMCLVLVLDFWMSVRRELRLHEADMRRDQHITGQALGVAFAGLWNAGERERALTLIERANRASGQGYVRWVELDAPPGSPLAPQLSRSDLLPVRQGREVQLSHPERNGPGRFFTYVPVRVGRVFPGALELSESLADTRRYFRLMLIRRIETAAALGGLSGLIAIILGALFVGRPIRGLVDKTRRIAAGDLSQPLDLHQHDELGELAREIDAMCVKLDAARERIADETRARIDAIDQLRHADRLATVGKLASGVAHELGTPLNVAAQRAKMIANGDVIGAEAADGARIIAEQTQRMTAVIRQLLDFARRQNPATARHDLRLVARQTAQFLAPLARRRGITLRVEDGEVPTYAEVDTGQIQQALTNLVMNGIQAMDQGGELSIGVMTRDARPPVDHGGAAGPYACLEVRDTGQGIRPEDLPHVFEPFFTTKQVGEGTGLGLSVAYGIVQGHAGWIEIDSTPGIGSTFSIYLPRAGNPARPDGGPAAVAGGVRADGTVSDLRAAVEQRR